MEHEPRDTSGHTVSHQSNFFGSAENRHFAM